jgi:N-carbamoylputrescine amidase
VVGANRTGHEDLTEVGQTFYGSSFVCDHRGDIVDGLGRDEEGVVMGRFDLDFVATHRAAWGFFRDRRPELYGDLCGPRPT